MFDSCDLTAAPGVDKVYLGRPWRPYAHTMFVNCNMGSHIRPEGWHNWNNTENEKTARYGEYGSKGPGAPTSGRVAWKSDPDATTVTGLLDLDKVFTKTSTWRPAKSNK